MDGYHLKLESVLSTSIYIPRSVTNWCRPNITVNSICRLGSWDAVYHQSFKNICLHCINLITLGVPSTARSWILVDNNSRRRCSNACGWSCKGTRLDNAPFKSESTTANNCMEPDVTDRDEEVGILFLSSEWWTPKWREEILQWYQNTNPIVHSPAGQSAWLAVDSCARIAHLPACLCLQFSLVHMLDEIVLVSLMKFTRG